MKESEENISSESKNDNFWVIKFNKMKETKYLAKVSSDFIEDGFNIYGLNDIIHDFDRAYNAILDYERGSNFENECSLYYMIHQRYIFTKTGCDNILEKVLNGFYGFCPISSCKDAVLAPIGLYIEPKKSNTKLICFKCQNIFEPKNSIKALDGCAWGPNFANYVFIYYKKYFKKENIEKYTPRLFGFKLDEADKEELNKL